MAYSKTEKTVWALAEPVVRREGCYLYDVEYLKEGGLWFLRIYVDKEPGGITLNECETVSRALSAALDEADPIPQNYYLEVASPGVERRLRMPEHFRRYLGAQVDVGLYRARNGTKQLTGILRTYDGERIGLDCGGEQVELPLAEAAVVHLHFTF